MTPCAQRSLPPKAAAFTRDCHDQYCKVYGINRGVWWGGDGPDDRDNLHVGIHTRFALILGTAPHRPLSPTLLRNTVDPLDPPL